jgi:transcriptional regulator with XRE-family HTH domain
VTPPLATDLFAAFMDDAEQEVAPARQYVGLVMRHLRSQAGLSQSELGSRINYTDSLIAHIEAGRRPPTPEFMAAADAAVGGAGLLIAGGRLTASVDHTCIRRAHPELEREAHSLHHWAPYTLPDFLQTEDYARALRRHQLPTLTASETELSLDVRRRQLSPLLGPERPTMTAVVDEAVLRRWAGGPEVMSEQLSWLLEWMEQPRVTVQVAPLDEPHYSPLTRPLVIAEHSRGRPTAYVEGHDGTTLIYKSEPVDMLVEHYGHLRAYALSPEASARLMRELAQKLDAGDTELR